MNSASIKYVCRYLEECLEFGFVPAIHDEQSPFCLLSSAMLGQRIMKRGHLEGET